MILLFFAIIGLGFEVKSVSRKEQISQMLNLFYCFHRTFLSIRGFPEPWVGAEKWGANEPVETFPESLAFFKAGRSQKKWAGHLETIQDKRAQFVCILLKEFKGRILGSWSLWDGTSCVNKGTFYSLTCGDFKDGLNTPKLNTVFGLVLINKYHKGRMVEVGYAQDSSTYEAEAERSQANLSYVGRPCFEKQKTK